MRHIEDRVFLNLMSSGTAMVSGLICSAIGEGTIAGILIFASFLLFFSTVKLILEVAKNIDGESEE